MDNSGISKMIMVVLQNVRVSIVGDWAVTGVCMLFLDITLLSQWWRWPGQRWEYLFCSFSGVYVGCALCLCLPLISWHTVQLARYTRLQTECVLKLLSRWLKSEHFVVAIFLAGIFISLRLKPCLHEMALRLNVSIYAMF